MNVTLHTTMGDIEITLFADKAPETVANFVSYVEDDFYANTIFHRVIDGFMIQGGGFEPGMNQKEVKAPIKNEANNGVSNKRGTIAMARTNDPHSATAQFFINVRDNSGLDFTGENPYGWGYCVFGEVTSGLDVVDAIRVVKTGSAGFHQDVPVEDVIITKTTLNK
ncbi:peptidylprolyl isomerase [Aliidiomarina iranensis]|uniref:Peptidyl-prolyl cis-trans isomerase n=1 Tax=Aliidiomarina iranensis TaxID=1434071 RepID=A0A432VWM8_9GAMM|nr:peptidylprolyl isomerase [Aliidiomarina iranensis]RUO21113.1 peptidylprolyl isomerase [Aliidiomarina iranensis]